MAKNRLSTSVTEKEKLYMLKRVEAKRSFGACLGCGGTNLEMISDKGYLVHRKFRCNDCGYEGAPIMFKNLKAYEKFFKTKRQKYNLRIDQEEADDFLAKPFMVPEKKNPFVALIASLLLPGAGQAYLGHIRKAWAVLILAFIAYTSLSFLLLYQSLIPENISWVLYTPFIILYIILISASMDAFLTARKLNYNTR